MYGTAPVPSDLGLRFSLAAWIKAMRAGHAVKTELACYGIALDERDPLYIHDISIFKQRASSAYWEAEDADIMEHVQEWGAKGVPIERSSRVLIHTHPNMAPTPSSTDEKVFRDLGGPCPFFVMCILTTERGVVPSKETTFARLAQRGPVWPLTIGLDVSVDMTGPLPEDLNAFLGNIEEEAKSKVSPMTYRWSDSSSSKTTGGYAGLLTGGNESETKNSAPPYGKARHKHWPNDEVTDMCSENGWFVSKKNRWYYDPSKDRRKGGNRNSSLMSDGAGLEAAAKLRQELIDSGLDPAEASQWVDEHIARIESHPDYDTLSDEQRSRLVTYGTL